MNKEDLIFFLPTSAQQLLHYEMTNYDQDFF